MDDVCTYWAQGEHRKRSSPPANTAPYKPFPSNGVNRTRPHARRSSAARFKLLEIRNRNFPPKNGTNIYSLPMHISHCDTDYYNWRWENYFAAGIRHRIEFEKFAREPEPSIVCSKLSNEIFSKKTSVKFVRPFRIEIRNPKMQHKLRWIVFGLHFYGKLLGPKSFSNRLKAFCSYY